MFTKANHEVYLPAGTNPEEALSSTTHLAIAALQDDIEITAIDGILQSLHNPEAHFSGGVVPDGHGSPRAGEYAHIPHHEMTLLRIEEQKAAVRLAYALDFTPLIEDNPLDGITCVPWNIVEFNTAVAGTLDSFI